jgi:hypothetical protein
LLGELPIFDWLRLHGWLELGGEAAFDRPFDENPTRVSAGLSAAFGQESVLLLGLLSEVAITGTPRAESPLPGIPPWLVGVQVGVRLDFTSAPATPCRDDTVCAAGSVCVGGVCMVERRVEVPVQVPVEREVVRAPPAFQIRGRVLDAESGGAIDAAQVRLVNTDTSPLASGADGRFQSWPIARSDGLLALKITAAGYRTREETVSRNPPGELLTLEIALTPEGKAGIGVILGVLQNAASGAAVSGTVAVLQLRQSFKTDARGRFSIEVPPGDYDVEVRAAGFVSQRKRVTVGERSRVIFNVDLERAR